MNVNNSKIGVIFSAFNLLRDIKMLEEAKGIVIILIMGLKTNPTLDRHEKNKPTQTVVELYIQLKACKPVDEIVPTILNKISKIFYSAVNL